MKYYHTPDGKVTRSTARYLREWRAIARPLAKLLDCRVIGFDPAITISPRSGEDPIQLTVSMARRIIDVAQIARTHKRHVSEKLKTLPEIRRNGLCRESC